MNEIDPTSLKKSKIEPNQTTNQIHQNKTKNQDDDDDDDLYQQQGHTIDFEIKKKNLSQSGHQQQIVKLNQIVSEKTVSNQIVNQQTNSTEKNTTPEVNDFVASNTDKPLAVCRHWLSGDCVRHTKNECKFLHPAELQGSAPVAKRTHRTNTLGRVRKVQDKSHQAPILRRFLLDKFGAKTLNSGTGVLDVAGGNSELSFQLLNLNEIAATIIDPRMQLNMRKFAKRLQTGVYHKSTLSGDLNLVPFEKVKDGPSQCPLHIPILFEEGLWLLDRDPTDAYWKRLIERSEKVVWGRFGIFSNPDLNPQDWSSLQYQYEQPSPSSANISNRNNQHGNSIAASSENENTNNRHNNYQHDNNISANNSQNEDINNNNQHKTDNNNQHKTENQIQSQEYVNVKQCLLKQKPKQKKLDPNSKAGKKKLEKQRRVQEEKLKKEMARREKVVIEQQALTAYNFILNVVNPATKSLAWMQKILENCSVIVGLHPDQATEPIVDFALKKRKPFVVVPCCVYANEFPHRVLDGKKVKSYEEFIEYLMRKDPGIEKTHLGFDGQDLCLYKLTY